MDENPGGTPNPLNPAPEGIKDSATSDEEMVVGTGVLEYTETEMSSDGNENNRVKPASFAKTAGGESSSLGIGVADPMMRPISDNDIEFKNSSSFDSLKTNEATSADVRKVPISFGEDSSATEPDESMGATNPEPVSSEPVAPDSPAPRPMVSETPELVAKDSIVEPASGNGAKKKIFAIGAIFLLIVAIICGAAAIAIAVLSNGGDKVTKAIDRLINGETSSIIAAKGNITTDSSDGNTHVSIDVDGTFDMKSSMNKVTAGINASLPGDQEFAIDVDEIRNKSSETFIKINGLIDMMNSLSPALLNVSNVESTNTLYSTNCINNGADTTNCSETVSIVSPLTTTFNMYSGLFEVIDDEWILVSDDFASKISSTGIYTNDTTCLIDAFGTLPQYGKDIANKYKANPFITYSTDKLQIAKKKDTLYRLSFDENKLTAFINSLSNNGFMNELNACAGNLATNSDTFVGMVKDIFAGFPVIYAEINDNYDFTRIYIAAEADDSQSTVADFSLSYPSELKITEPSDYLEMSAVLNQALPQLFTNNTLPY